MTPEELERMVANCETTALVEAAAGLPEAGRRKLSTTAQKLFRDYEKARWSDHEKDFRTVFERVKELRG